MNSSQAGLTRRSFITRSTSVALVLGLDMSSNIIQHAVAASQSDWQPNAFLKINSDNQVTVIIKHIEFGQGTYTGLATLVAEELDAGWDQVSCEHAPADASRYANLNWGPVQGTGGSSAIANSFMQMRKAGATAKAMLLSAASQTWQVPVDELVAEQGVISHKKSNKKALFGDLIATANDLPVPQDVKLKSPDQFKLIGQFVNRKDVGKTDGSAVFTQDIQLPDMLTAVVVHPPKFGAKLVSVDDKKALKVAGVKASVKLKNGVAVLADTFWQAKTGRDQLKVKWDDSSEKPFSTEQLISEYRDLAGKPGAVAATQGDNSAGFSNADKTLEADYVFPFLAHATMEPMNCVVQLTWDKSKKAPVAAQLWYGCQLHTMDQGAIAANLGIAPENVKINTVFAGGSFGRRGNSVADYVIEAVDIAKIHKTERPVKLVWTREDDTQAGYFRPLYYHRIKAAYNKQGKIQAWQHRIVGQSILTGSPMEGMIKDGIDFSSVEGATHLPYDLANMQVELHTTETPIPVLWWRSVGSTHTAYATEVFIDEIARTVKRDPLQYRLSLLGDDKRYRTVLETAAQKANYPEMGVKGNHYYGIALHKSFSTYVAQVAEIEKASGGYKINKIVCVVDCGIAVNPDVIKAQMEGGIGYGLSPALMSEVSFNEGEVASSNFHNYQVIRMKDMPTIEVHIIPSAEPPTGVGEPSTPVVAPAIANALLAAGESPQRKQPMTVKFV